MDNQSLFSLNFVKTTTEIGSRKVSIKLFIKLCVFTLLFWSFYFSNSPMEWTKRHDTMLFREVLVVNPYQAKKKTVQRGQLWQTVAGNLVQLEDPVFKKSLSKRSVQDRCTLLCEKHKKRMRYETKASGISPNVTELDNLIEEIDVGKRGGE